MKKILVIFVTLTLLLFPLRMVSVKGQEELPTPIPETSPSATPEATSEPIPTSTEEVTPTSAQEISLIPTEEPVPTPEITPTIEPTPELTPTPEASPTPTPELTPTPEPEIVPEPPIDTTRTPISAGIGIVEGYGQKFEIIDSEYFNLVTESSEEIYLRIESFPEMVIIKIRAQEGIEKTSLKIFGWEPETTYHKYLNDYHNHEEITADTERTIEFEVNLDSEKSQLIFIQPRPSTKYIKDDTSGGNCTLFGTWNAGTKTCTMTADLTETIQIDSNNITLDGNGKSITGSNSGNGIYFTSKSGITVKNVNIKKFSLGLYGRSSNGVNLHNNTVSDCTNRGITFENTTLISMTGNQMVNNRYNFNIIGSSDAYFDHNINTSNQVDGKSVYFLKNISGQTYDLLNAADAGVFYCYNCQNVTIKDLSFAKNWAGVFLWKAFGNRIENISASGNDYGVYIGGNSNNNVVIDNNFSGNGYGIYTNQVSQSSIKTNTVTNTGGSGNGIYIQGGTQSALEGNLVSGASYGISLSYTSQNTMRNNQMDNNSLNFQIDAYTNDAYYFHDIDTTNLINGKKIYYYKYLSGGVYDNLADVGAIYCVSCNNVTFSNMVMANLKSQAGVFFYLTNNSRIENITVSENGYKYGLAMFKSHYNTLSGLNIEHSYNDSLYLNYSDHNTITTSTVTRGNRGISLYRSNYNQLVNNTATNNSNGFYLNYSANNTFSGNTASNNNYGFDHSGSTYNTYDNNTAKNNQQAGFDLYRSSNNTLINNVSNNNRYGVEIYYNASDNDIHDNTFANNAGNDYKGAGVLLRPYSGSNNCHNNKIYRNNFLDNAAQAKIEPNTGSGNVFNLASPMGGNYWSDHSGPDANEDGFIDITYYFDGGADSLPRVCPGGSLTVDNQAPNTTVSLSGDPGSGSWYRSNVAIELSASDSAGVCGGEPSGVARTEYSFDKANWTTYTFPINFSTEGGHTLYYRSVDNNGNVEGTGQEEVFLLEDQFNLPNGSPHGWTVARGTWAIQNQELNAVIQTSYPTEAFAYKGDLSWENYTVEVKFHPQNSTSWWVRLGTRFNGNPSPYAGGYSRYGFYVGSTSQGINKCVTGTCYGSNYSTKYSLSGSVWHILKVELDGNKQRYYLDDEFYYEVTDGSLTSGNIYLSGSYSGTGKIRFDDVRVTTSQPIPPAVAIKIDKTSPTLNASFAGTLEQGGWYTTDVLATITASDNQEIDQIQYGYDDLNWNTYAGPVNLASSGETTLYYRAFDLAGNSAAGQQLIKIDKTPPVTSLDLDGSLGNNNWYVSDVTATLTAVDNEGGLDQGKTEYNLDGVNWQDYDSPFSISNEETTTLRYRSIDSAGNIEGTRQETIKIDKTSPFIIGSRAPEANGFGWNNKDVTVSFVCDDNQSGIADCSEMTVLAEDGANQSVVGTAIDQAGNSTQATVDNINIDKSLPTIAASRDLAPNDLGWNKSDVTVSFTCDDQAALSGVDSCSAPITLSEGENQNATGIVTDKAGNSVSITESGLNIDKTPPEITAVVDRSANTNNWYKDDVTVIFTCEDLLSGIEICTDPETLGEGAAQSSTGEATDKAGNTTSVTEKDINVDKTMPTITGSRTPVANAHGWNNSDVTIHFDCSDGLSGIESCSPDSILSAEGAGQSAVGEVTDLAGNPASTTVADINIDKTSPEVTDIILPEANDLGWYNVDVPIHYTCTDDLSGPLNSSGDKLLTSEGENQSQILDCEDFAGNIKEITQTPLNIDKTAPTASDDYGFNGVWVNVNALIGLAAADPAPEGVIGSGVEFINYCRETAGGCDPSLTGTAYVEPVNIDTEGIEFLSYLARDKAGNWGLIQEVKIMLDLTAPQASVTIDDARDDQCSFFFQFWIDDGEVSHDVLHGCAKIDGQIDASISGTESYTIKLMDSNDQVVKQTSDAAAVFNFETSESVYAAVLEVTDLAGNFASAKRMLYEDDDNDVSTLSSNGGAPDLFDICPAQVPNVDANKDGCQDIAGVDVAAVNWCLDTYTGLAATSLNPVPALSQIGSPLNRRFRNWLPIDSTINNQVSTAYKMNITDRQGPKLDLVVCSIDADNLKLSNGNLLTYGRWDNAKLVYWEYKGAMRVREGYHTHELSDGSKIYATIRYDERNDKSRLHFVYNNEDLSRACVKMANQERKTCVQDCGKDRSCHRDCLAQGTEAIKACVQTYHYQLKEEYPGYRTLSVYDILKLAQYE